MFLSTLLLDGINLLEKFHRHLYLQDRSLDFHALCALYAVTGIKICIIMLVEPLTFHSVWFILLIFIFYISLIHHLWCGEKNGETLLRLGAFYLTNLLRIRCRFF